MLESGQFAGNGCLLGSQTLSRWRKLATPNLAGVLEHRPGVQIKGQHLAKCFEEEKYSIGDYEEDGICSLRVPSLCKVYYLHHWLTGLMFYASTHPMCEARGFIFWVCPSISAYVHMCMHAGPDVGILHMASSGLLVCICLFICEQNY